MDTSAQETTTMSWGLAPLKPFNDPTESLETQLKASTYEAWKSAKRAVCAEAYAPYREGTIYPLMLMRCDQNLNQTLLEEMKELGERQ